MPHSQYPNDPSGSPVRRRSDAGQIRLQPRDVAGLVTLAEMYAAPYDLLAARLGVPEAGLRGITARWRGAGLVATGHLAEGPFWCWLTPAGMRQVGHKWEAAPPPLARLAHVRAALAARMWLEGGEAWKAGRASWRCERLIREGRPAAGQAGHLPDAEVLWPSLPGSPRGGETWCVEVELTPKAAARTQQIMAGLLAGQYAQVVYLCAPAAFGVVSRAAGQFPGQAARVLVRELPPAALMRDAA